MEIVVKSQKFLVMIVAVPLRLFVIKHKIFCGKIFSLLMNEGKTQNVLHCFSSLILD